MNELIGARVPRLEDHALLTGKGRFVDDIAAAGVLVAAFVRSPHPHALIRSIDTSAARALPGVVAVLTLDDLAPVLKQRRMMRTSNSGTKLDQSWPFALADGEVSFVGEPVAIVVAEDRYVAEDAAALVAVDYDVLPAATDCRIERAPPVRRELAINRVIAYKVAYGDAEAAFAKAAHVVHEDLWIHRGAAHSMEGRAILAQISDRETVVWASTQKAHDLRTAFADYIDLDESRLRVATPDVGGGFGPKLCVYPEDVAVVAAATLAAPFGQMDRGPPRAFHQCGARARPILVDRACRGCRRARARRARPPHSRHRRLCAAGREYPVQFRDHAHRPLYGAGAGHGRGRDPHQQGAGVIGARRRLSAGGVRDGTHDRPAGAQAETRPRRIAPPQSDPGGKDAVSETAESAFRRTGAI